MRASFDDEEASLVSDRLLDILFAFHLEQWAGELGRAGVRTEQDFARIASPDNLPDTIPQFTRHKIAGIAPTAADRVGRTDGHSGRRFEQRKGGARPPRAHASQPAGRRAGPVSAVGRLCGRLCRAIVAQTYRPGEGEEERMRKRTTVPTSLIVIAVMAIVAAGTSSARGVNSWSVGAACVVLGCGLGVAVPVIQKRLTVRFLGAHTLLVTVGI
eukprot:gene19758-2876_t